MEKMEGWVGGSGCRGVGGERNRVEEVEIVEIEMRSGNGNLGDEISSEENIENGMVLTKYAIRMDFEPELRRLPICMFSLQKEY